jgi:hypothetical protein
LKLGAALGAEFAGVVLGMGPPFPTEQRTIGPGLHEVNALAEIVRLNN